MTTVFFFIFDGEDVVIFNSRGKTITKSSIVKGHLLGVFSLLHTVEGSRLQMSIAFNGDISGLLNRHHSGKGVGSSRLVN